MNTAETDVVCAGILVADIFVPPLPRLPEAGELLATDDFLLDTGGCAANTAASLRKLGVSASVVGKVGSDDFGTFVLDNLAAKGLDTTGVARSANFGTSKTVILPVKGQDRRYLHTFGANADFRAEDIPPVLLDRARVFYLGGYLVLPALEQAALSALFRRARAGGARTVLDVVVPAGGAGWSLSVLEQVLPHTDLFLPNREEAQLLTGERDPARQAERLLAAGCDRVVITQGADGALYADRHDQFFTPAFPVEVVDGSGAGDAFAAGVIVGLLEGWDARRMLRFASAVGASACTQLGCTAGVFTRAEAEAFLQSH